MLSSHHTSSHLVAIKLVSMSHSLVLVSCSVECCLVMMKVIMPACGVLGWQVKLTNDGLIFMCIGCGQQVRPTAS
jgi:hypothetical protein